MKIAAFPLPSNPFTEIIFRSPTVSDSMEYIDISPEDMERVTTQYLNALQVGALNDSGLWTQQDRRTALWWIFVNSRDDAYLTYTYDCGHCGKVHHADVDMSELGETITLLTVPPFVECSIPVEGVPTNWKICPLSGRDAEVLERIRFTLPESTDKGFHAAMTQLRLSELALMTRTDTDPDDYTLAADHRLEMIKRMHLGHEFPALVARIQLMTRDLKHGLDMEVSNLGVRLQLPLQPCKEIKEGEAPKFTNLRAPFLNSEFIARLRPEWMANHHQ